jgi:hypothetical protein
MSALIAGPPSPRSGKTNLVLRESFCRLGNRHRRWRFAAPYGKLSHPQCAMTITARSLRDLPRDRMGRDHSSSPRSKPTPAAAAAFLGAGSPVSHLTPLALHAWRPTKRRRSSITVLAFHGIYTSRVKSAGKCNPCVRYVMEPMSRAAQSWNNWLIWPRVSPISF